MMRDLKRFFESLFVVSLKCENDPKHYKLEHNGSSFCIEKATAAAKRNFSYTKGGRKTGLLAATRFLKVMFTLEKAIEP